MILQADPSTVVTLHPRRVHPRRRWLLIVALSTAVPVLLACTFFPAYWDDAEIGNGLETEHWDGIPRFVETVLPKTSIPKNSTIRQRICITSADLWSRYGWKLAAKRSFSATPSQVCNIRDSLTECMKLTGTRYLIAHEVEFVSFGHTNVLNGEEWVKAFEEALQNNRPHCWRWVAGWHHWGKFTADSRKLPAGEGCPSHPTGGLPKSRLGQCLICHSREFVATAIVAEVGIASRLKWRWRS